MKQIVSTPYAITWHCQDITLGLTAIVVWSRVVVNSSIPIHELRREAYTNPRQKSEERMCGLDEQMAQNKAVSFMNLAIEEAARKTLLIGYEDWAVTVSSDQRNFDSFWKIRSNVAWHPEHVLDEVPARKLQSKGPKSRLARRPREQTVHSSGNVQKPRYCAQINVFFGAKLSVPDDSLKNRPVPGLSPARALVSQRPDIHCFAELDWIIIICVLFYCV